MDVLPKAVSSEGATSGDCTPVAATIVYAYDCSGPGDLLRSEICHRVKNNLAMVVSLLGMQARSAKDEGAAEQLRDAAHRVEVLCSLHDQLSRAMAPMVSAGTYLQRLASTLATALSLPLKTIVVSVAADEMPLPSGLALSMGLIVNELVTNAYKHADPAPVACKVDVSLSREGDVLCLKVADNGPGLPDGFSERRRPGLGMRLVCGLVNQHGGTVSWSAGAGTRVVVTMPLPQKGAEPVMDVWPPVGSGSLSGLM